MLEMAGSCKQHPKIDLRANLKGVLEQKEIGCKACTHNRKGCEQHVNHGCFPALGELGMCRTCLKFANDETRCILQPILQVSVVGAGISSRLAL